MTVESKLHIEARYSRLESKLRIEARYLTEPVVPGQLSRKLFPDIGSPRLTLETWEYMVYHSPRLTLETREFVVYSSLVFTQTD